MSCTFHVEPDSVELLNAHGLGSFAALMNKSLGEKVSRPDDRGELYRLSLLDHVARVGFYLKRMRGESVVRLSKSFIFGRRPHTGPFREAQLLISLQEAGFAVMKPIAWGEERRYGLPVAGFLLVEEVRGREAATLFDTGSIQQRYELLEEIGALVGRLHAAGFFHPVRLKDLFRDDYSRQLVLIDRETSKPWPVRFARKHALTALARSARRTLRDGHRFGAAETRSFLSGYKVGVAPVWAVDYRELRGMMFTQLRRELT